MSLRDEANHEQELEALRAALRRAQAQLAKATTVTGVKNALGPLLDALS